LFVGSACAAGGNLALAQPAAPAADGATPPGKAAAVAGEPVLRIASKNEQVKVVERFSKVLTLSDRIARVDGFDQEVIDVTALDSRSVRVHAKAPGVTTMTLLDERDRTYSVDVLVVGDVRHLQEMIARLFPNAAVEVVEVQEAVVLRGWVTQPDQITEIVEIAEQFYPRVLNQMKVGCVQQVTLKVKVMEVQRSRLRQLGVNFVYAGDGGYAVSLPGTVSPVTSLNTSLGRGGGLATTGLGRSVLAFGSITNGGAFNAFVDALKQENLLKILAEPELTTMNGRPANLLAGGEFPILVPNGLGTVGVQYRPFGVRLEAVPIVLSTNRVRLELQSEVSDQDLNNAVELQGFRVPSLTQRRANTQVELNFGETLVIAGLISQSRTASTSKVPIIGDMPYIGAAFSRKTYTDAETELVIMVTPELVAPMTPDQLPPGGPGLFTDVPTDKELYFYNMIEVPSYGDRCVGTCRPPVPTYDPYHPVGPEHIAPPGMIPPSPLPPGPGMMPGQMMPPGAPPVIDGPSPYPPVLAPEVVPPTPAGPEPVVPAAPSETGPAAEPSFPPPAPSPSTTSVGFPRRTTAAAASSTRQGAVVPAGHSRLDRGTKSRPGLIEPGRPATQP
jgi:pilus assembly protein CpaC